MIQRKRIDLIAVKRDNENLKDQHQHKDLLTYYVNVIVAAVMGGFLDVTK